VRDTLQSLSTDLLAVEQPAPITPPGTAGVTTILGYAAWAVTIACVLGVLVTAIMMALKHRRGEGAEHMGNLGWIMVAAILGSAAGPLVTAVA